MIIQKKGSMVRVQRGQDNITRNSSLFKPIKGLSPICLEKEEDENDKTDFEGHCHPPHMPSSAENNTDTVPTSSSISIPLFEPETLSLTTPVVVPGQHSGPQRQR